jgi:hypothetical protein
MDKLFWLQIQENDYAFPEGHSLNTLTAELLGYLESPNPELRIGFAYLILGQWIAEKNLYTDAELAAMQNILLANLQKGLGESGTDSIFLRSFSIWILTFIFQRDIKFSFISESKFNALVDRIAAYMQAEQDFRGWVHDKGWAHAAAHLASMLDVIAQHPHANTATHERILTLIGEHMTRQIDHVYQHGEDDRMAQAVSTILVKNQVDMAFLRAWLSKLESVMELASAGMPFDIKIFNAYMNVRNLARSVYFPIELCVPEKPTVWEEFRPALLDAIKEIGLC